MTPAQHKEAYDLTEINSLLRQILVQSTPSKPEPRPTKGVPDLRKAYHWFWVAEQWRALMADYFDRRARHGDDEADKRARNGELS